MSELEPAGDLVARRLIEAIERLHKDVETIELWASAVAGFCRPVPGYQPKDTFILPPRPDEANGEDKSS